MANPKSLREQISDLEKRISELGGRLQTIQSDHNAEIQYYQQTVEDLVKKQDEVEQKNASLEAKQQEMLADIKLLKIATSTLDLNTLKEIPTIVVQLRKDIDTVKDKIESPETSTNGSRDHTRDLIEQDATLQNAIRDIATLRAGIHRHELKLEALDSASRGLLSDRDSGLQHQNSVQRSPNTSYEIQNRESNGTRNRQVVYEIPNDDEQLDTMSAGDLIRSHRRNRGRSEEDLDHEEIPRDQQRYGAGGKQLHPQRKRLKLTPDSQLEMRPAHRAQTAIKIWIDDPGELQTDRIGSDQDYGWQRLKEIWKDQVEKMNNKNPDLEYLTVDLRSKCLYSVGIGMTVHFWTKSSAGKYTCRICANTGRLCFVRIGGRLEALPLPALSEHKIDRIDDIFVVKEDAQSTVSRRYPKIW